MKFGVITHINKGLLILFLCFTTNSRNINPDTRRLIKKTWYVKFPGSFLNIHISNNEKAIPTYLPNILSKFFKVFIDVPPFYTLFKIDIRIDILLTSLQ